MTDETTDYDPEADRVTVAISVDGETLTVTLDGDLRVVDADRSREGADGESTAAV